MKCVGRVDDFSQGALGIAMIAAFLLFGGGVKLAYARQTRRKGILMIVAALVIIMNVMIWTV